MTNPPPRTEIARLNHITLAPQRPPSIVEINANDGFFFNAAFSHDRRLRVEIYERLLRARRHLRDGLHLMIYEAYRPKAKQVELWHAVMAGIQQRYPSMPPQQQRDLCETFVADPFNGIGSGHQSGCAIDLSLCDSTGQELDMGCPVNEESDRARTQTDLIPQRAQENRAILKQALENEGFINYPAEWWHFSFGDHLWAWYANQTTALFGPLDL